MSVGSSGVLFLRSADGWEAVTAVYSRLPIRRILIYLSG